MRLAIPREAHAGEDRASVTPETVKKLVRLGAELIIESGAGAGAGFSDEDYAAEGTEAILAATVHGALSLVCDRELCRLEALAWTSNTTPTPDTWPD